MNALGTVLAWIVVLALLAFAVFSLVAVARFAVQAIRGGEPVRSRKGRGTHISEDSAGSTDSGA